MTTRRVRADYATKSDLGAVRDELRSDIQGLGTNLRAVGVVVERLESKLGALTEGLADMALKSDVKALEERLSGRMSLLEDVVRQSASDVRKNSEDMRLLRNEVAQLRLQFDRRDLDVDDLKRRMAELEKRLGIVSGA